MLDRRIFFDHVRGAPFAGNLDQKQVDGLNFLLDVWEAERAQNDPRHLAYCLATAFKETNRTMRPVREAYYLVKQLGSEAAVEEWRKRNLRYWPDYGRGYVQLTWPANYQRYGIAHDRDRALDPKFAAHIMYDGMERGVFTGKKLSDYFDHDTDDPRQARRIINGMDCADEIAGYHRAFLAAINAADVPAPAIEIPAPPMPEPPPAVSTEDLRPPPPRMEEPPPIAEPLPGPVVPPTSVPATGWSWTRMLLRIKATLGFGAAGGTAALAYGPDELSTVFGQIKAMVRSLAELVGGPANAVTIVLVVVGASAFLTNTRIGRKILHGEYLPTKLRAKKE